MIDADVILEVTRAIIVGAILIYLWKVGQKEDISSQHGWRYILAGFSFLFFGMLVDITDNFPVLNKYIVIGDTGYQAFLEKVVGYLVGFILLAIGFWKWMPTIVSLRNVQHQLRDHHDELESVIKDRTNNLLNTTDYLNKEVKDRKQAEEELLEGKRKLSTLMNNLPGMAYRCANDKDWSMQFVSDGALALTECTPSELMSQKVTYGSLVLPEEAEYVWNTVQEKISQKCPFEVEYRIRTPSGQIKWVWEKGIGIFSEDDHLLALEGFITDITKLKQSEAEQAQLQSELQQAQKLEAMGQLTGGIAHDFNNILGIILGYTSLALKRFTGKDQDKLVEYLTHVEKAGERAKGLVSKMLAFSRNEPYNHKPLLIQSVLSDDIKMLSAILPSSIEISTEIEEDVPAVLTDKTQLNQLLMNLCVNARDAMNGQGMISIRLVRAMGVNSECSACSRQVTGDWVELSITDTGSGISTDAVKRIFDPFFTTKGVGKGTGMGLSVIHGIMRSHGGHVLVTTEVGRGTTFRLMFPPADEPIAETADIDQPAVELPHGQSIKVLVLDDEPDLGAYLGELLESQGYLVTVMSNSEDALEFFKQKPDEFALLITDQTMPGMTGVDLIKSVREICPNMPAILNTGFSNDIDAEIAAEMDVSYLEKPVQATSLFLAVDELLGTMGHGSEQ